MSVEEIEQGWTATKLRRAAVRVSLAKSRFEIAVQGAYDQGMSLREIAAVTHVSHEQVRRIVARSEPVAEIATQVGVNRRHKNRL